ncbi:hypothetical protein C2E23DRAFT_801665, partial [Lenzites betulinus]
MITPSVANSTRKEDILAQMERLRVELERLELQGPVPEAAAQPSPERAPSISENAPVAGRDPVGPTTGRSHSPIPGLGGALVDVSISRAPSGRVTRPPLSSDAAAALRPVSQIPGDSYLGGLLRELDTRRDGQSGLTTGQGGDPPSDPGSDSDDGDDGNAGRDRPAGVPPFRPRRAREAASREDELQRELDSLKQKVLSQKRVPVLKPRDPKLYDGSHGYDLSLDREATAAGRFLTGRAFECYNNSVLIQRDRQWTLKDVLVEV